jgi:hypothetical protein
MFINDLIVTMRFVYLSRYVWFHTILCLPVEALNVVQATNTIALFSPRFDCTPSSYLLRKYIELDDQQLLIELDALLQDRRPV